MQIKSKLPNVGTTIFSIMSKLAAEEGAINLSQGFPDFPCDNELLDLVTSNMKKGFNQYAPMPGVPALREEISRKMRYLYNKKYNPDTEVTVTSGATQAIFTALAAIVHPGDEVIVIEPAYDCYAPSIELLGGTPVYTSTFPPNYAINWEDVRKKITPKTRALIINSPHNPTGKILDEEDIEELKSIIKEFSILLISDEVYEHIIYDQKPHISISSIPELAKNAFVLFSFGKTFHVTGWKLGYVVAPEYLMTEFRKVHQFNVFTANTPMQMALAEYLKNEDHYKKLPSFYQKKRNFFVEGMKKSRFDLLSCKGSYFICATYSKISDMGDQEFARHITKNNKVAVIPNSSFYHDGTDKGVIRFCFAKKEETLQEAIQLLCKI